MQRHLLILATLTATLAGPVLAQTDAPPPPPPGGDAMAPAVGGEMPPSPHGGPQAGKPGKPPRGPHGGMMGMMGMMPPPPPMPGISVKMGQGQSIDIRCGDTDFTACLQAAMPVIDKFMTRP